MPIQSYKLGPGTLKLGPTATALDVSCQVRSCTITAAETVTETTEAMDALCGETLPAEETATYAYTMAATMIQDLAAAGVVAWSWTNEGQSAAFEFVPNTAAAAKIVGTIKRVTPLGVGGDVKTRPTSDLAWPLDGKPTPTWSA